MLPQSINKYRININITVTIEPGAQNKTKAPIYLRRDVCENQDEEDEPVGARGEVVPVGLQTDISFGAALLGDGSLHVLVLNLQRKKGSERQNSK